MWFSPQSQSRPRPRFPSRERRGAAVANLMPPYFLLLPIPSAPRRIRLQIDSMACREEIWRCHCCGGKRRFPLRHGGVRFATWLHLPRFQRPREAKQVPRRFIPCFLHSCTNLTFPFSYVATYEISNDGKEVKSMSGTWFETKSSSCTSSTLSAEERRIVSKKVTQLFARPVHRPPPPPSLACSGVITILRLPLLPRSILSIENVVRNGRSSGVKVFPDRALPSSVPAFADVVPSLCDAKRC